jgi:LmbE family N-acetylglucosaminyl deacetylase
MKRREFIARTTVGGVLAATDARSAGPQQVTRHSVSELTRREEVVIERAASGKPHAGKVLAVIQPHADDIPHFAAGTVAKLIDEGYTGYLIRTSNDDMAGVGTPGETMLNNEKDNDRVATVLGLRKVFNLEYRNHRMDDIARVEMRARLIFLFRLLKVDTVVCYDPWGLYEENPDHYVTAQVVESACWMAGGDKDYPEHFAAGLQARMVGEKYYFARGPQLANRIVDITPYIDKKVEANLANVTQGPAGQNGSRVRSRLAAQGRRLPILGSSDDSANRLYIKNIVLDYDSLSLRGVLSDREVGRSYGLEWAEAFHYIGPPQSKLDRYISENAVAL